MALQVCALFVVVAVVNCSNNIGGMAWHGRARQVVNPDYIMYPISFIFGDLNSVLRFSFRCYDCDCHCPIYRPYTTTGFSFFFQKMR